MLERPTWTASKPTRPRDLELSPPVRYVLNKPTSHEKLVLGKESVAPELSYLTWHRSGRRTNYFGSPILYCNA